MRFKWVGLLCGLLVLAFGAVNCGAQQYQAPEGKYAVTQGNEKYELNLSRGHFRWEDASNAPGLILQDGSYQVNGNQIQFNVTRRTAEDVCAASERAFVYAWNFDGKALTLTTVQDPCARRSEILSGQAWNYLGTPE